MTQEAVMKLYESSEQFRLSRQKGQLSGSKDILAEALRLKQEVFGNHKRSLPETAMHRVKQLLGPKKLQCSAW